MEELSGLSLLSMFSMWAPWLVGLTANGAMLVITATTWRATASAGWLLLALSSGLRLLQAVPGAVQNYLIFSRSPAQSGTLLGVIGMGSSLLGLLSTGLLVVGAGLAGAEFRRALGKR